MTDLAELLHDLADEGDQLEQIVTGAADWSLPTPADGWSIGHQIGHLAWTDEVSTVAATDADRFAALLDAALTDGDPSTSVDRAADEWAARPDLPEAWRQGRAGLLEALAAVPAGTRLPWFGPPMSPASMATARIMETWAHGQDVADALSVERPATHRIRHVAHIGVRTRDFAYAIRGTQAPAEQFRVELVGPADEVWEWGPPGARQRVSGPALDFCLLVTQRRHRGDLGLVAEGPDADHWLDIAQAFAGAPGPGRPRVSR